MNTFMCPINICVFDKKNSEIVINSDVFVFLTTIKFKILHLTRHSCSLSVL